MTGITCTTAGFQAAPEFQSVFPSNKINIRTKGTTATRHRRSYKQTCQNIRVSGNTLYATCKMMNRSGWRETALRNFDQCGERSRTSTESYRPDESAFVLFSLRMDFGNGAAIVLQRTGTSGRMGSPSGISFYCAAKKSPLNPKRRVVYEL
jgi:hypothetical protein